MIADKIQSLAVSLIGTATEFPYLMPAVKFHMEAGDSILKIFILGHTTSTKLPVHLSLGLCGGRIAHHHLFFGGSRPGTILFFLCYTCSVSCRVRYSVIASSSSIIA